MGKLERTDYQRGFTLIELMIVVAVIGLLASVAYPIYSNAIAKGDREDAISALLKQQGTMEEYYLNNDTYNGAPLFNPAGKSQRGKYDITIASADAYSYTITATRNDGGDANCKTMSINNLGQKTSSPSAADECWGN